MKVVRKKSVKKLKITHNKWLFVIIILLLIFLVSVIWIILKDRAEIVGVVEGDICVRDSDCIPVSGCHPSECIIKDKYVEPSERLFCSAVCSGPLDCGAGSCGCVNNKCVVVPASI